jgi:hypothetical protein
VRQSDRVGSAVEPRDATETERPNKARMYSYWLGGAHHEDADRRRAERVMVCSPHLPYLVRSHRAFLQRVVRYLVDAGVSQFLDLGSGLPVDGNVHETAHAVDPACRVVYVDHDRTVATEAAELLARTDGAELLLADMRRPEQVFTAVERCRLLDLGKPVAVLMVDVLQYVSDAEDPAELICAYTDAVCSGSYLAVSHTSADPEVLAGIALYPQLYDTRIPPMTFRHPMRVVEFLSHLDLVDPGVVPVPLWRPDPDQDTGLNPRHFTGCAAVGRKR